MNGENISDIKNMTEGEFRVLLVTKMEDFQADLVTCKKDMKSNKRCLNDLKVQVAKIPHHCIQVNAIKEQGEKIVELEKKDAASKAVKSLLIGLVGGLGGSGGVVALLKWVFNIIP